MKFEYDPNKSTSNFSKHGIDFEKVQVLWDDHYLLVVPAKGLNEQRYLHIGKIGDKHWSAITTVRGTKLRIISARRSRQSEIELYESERFR